MPVVISLEDGREYVVQNSLTEVNKALKAINRTGGALEIETPTGSVFINPRQILSFAHADQAELEPNSPRVPEPA